MTTTTRPPEPAPAPEPGRAGGGAAVRTHLARIGPFLPAVPVVAAWILWGHYHGGYFARSWYPGALAALALLVALVVARRRVLPASRPVALALGLFMGLVAWSYLSLLWSDTPGDGLTASNKFLLYLLSAWILALLPWTPRAAAVMLGAWVAGVTAVCSISLLDAHGTNDIGRFFIEGRYLDPIGYANGVSALPAMALFPAFVLAYRRETPALLRPLALAASVVLLEFSLLPQSRGALIGLILTIPLFVLLASDRLRLVLPGLVLIGATALAVGPIYEVYDVATVATQGTPNPPAVGPVLDSAANAVLLTSLLALALGVVLTLLDRAVRPGPIAVARARRGVGVALGLVALTAVVVALVNSGAIADKADESWTTFKSGKDTPAQAGARLTTVYADQRYDYFRVAYEAFEEKPVAGIGFGGYERRYTEERAFEKPSRYAHNIWLRVMGELGLVGLLLLAGFVVAGAGRAAWIRRRLGGPTAALVASMVCASIYFFVHASFDWLEEFPALASPAFALPLVALAIACPAATAARARPRAVRAGAGLATAVFLLAAAVALGPAYLATRYDDRAARTWTANPQAAFRDLDRASGLAPLSARPELRAGTLAVDLGELGRARRHFQDSLDREDTWYAHLSLALIASHQGRKQEASREIRIALTLNREDPFVSEAFTRVRRGRKLDPAAFNQDIEELNRDRFTRPDN
ncbi:MAG TPA: O-antigen ligase family protein [Thermoleophilaceae bacterium]|nr:O-antigen ligase family protein [Thermoleophilaceae bacterium]